MIVVSTDSDYLFRSRDDVSLVLLRQNTQKRREFTRYDAHAVRTATGLSPAAWRILAITSGNDYAANKKHFGLTRNLRLIRTICNEGYTLELDILTQYCQRTNMSVHHFGHAVTVFIYNGQTLLPPEVATTDLDDYLLASIFAVGFNLQEYAFMDTRHARVEAAPQPVYGRPAPYMRFMPRIKYRPKPFPRPGWQGANAAPVEVEDDDEDDDEDGDEDDEEDEVEEEEEEGEGDEGEGDEGEGDEGEGDEEKEKDDKGKKKSGASKSKKPRLEDKPKKDPVRRMPTASFINNYLWGRFAQVTLDLGTLDRHLRDSVQTTYPHLDNEQQLVVVQEVQMVIRDLVNLNTDLMYHGQRAVALFTVYIMQRNPDLNVADVAMRQTVFRHFAGESPAFYRALMTGLKDWARGDSGAETSLVSAGGSTTAATWSAQTCATLALSLYKTVFDEAGPAQPVNTQLAAGLGHFIQQAADQLHTQMVTHWTTKTPELMKKVKEENFEWAGGVQGISFLEILMTKESRTSMTRQLLVSVFGTQTDARKWCHYRPGDIVNRLFFGSNSSYKKGIGLVSSALTLNAAETATFDTLRQAIDMATHVDGRYIRNVEQIKTLIQKGLKTPDEYRRMPVVGRRHILTGTIQTDGFQIRPLAYKLTQRKFQKSDKFKSGLPVTVKAGYLTKRLPTLAKIRETFGTSLITVAAIDPGVVKTAQLCIIKETSGHYNDITRLTVPRTAQTTSTTVFQKELQWHKDQEGIGIQESTIRPLGVGSGTSFTWESYRDALVAHIKSSLMVFENLRAFYSSKKMKAIHWDRKCASKTEMSRAVGCIVKAVTEDPNNKPLIVMGNGKFSIKSGVVYTDKFAKALFSAAQAAGIPMHYVSEYKTSQLCCVCRHKTKKKGRLLDCKHCGGTRDRDDNASQNMGNLSLDWVRFQQWDPAFQRAPAVQQE
ncbi:hypothetical protein BGZ72_000761 [Mortierella alpina]|nr:hypothetical protein BGZ72_000761 [Mortierella alpina]